MSNDFNVHKWRREFLNEGKTESVSETELFAAFKKEFGSGSHTPGNNMITILEKNAPKDNAAKAFFNKHGYSVTIETDEGERGEREPKVEYHYKKK